MMQCKKLWFLLFGLVLAQGLLGQQQRKKHINAYTLHLRQAQQARLYMPIGTHTQVLRAGWTLTETIGGYTVQRTLQQDTLITAPVDSLLRLHVPLRLEHIQHTKADPGKVYLNPFPFYDSSGARLNQIAYVALEPGEKILFTHVHTKWSAITVPFSIRPAVGNLASQVTSEFKLGTAFSLNHDWEVHTNRRMDVRKNIYGFSVGMGFGLGRVPLNNGTTSLSGANYDNEQEGLILFITPGLGLNIRGFKVLGFYGWDVGLTRNTRDWNYNRKPYIGIGLGFDFWTRR